MAGAIFTLKYRDTLPVLDVFLKNPDGTAHDLTGSTGWKLHIKLNNGTVLTRALTKVSPDTAGHLQYAWQATDWDAGALIVGPVPPLKPTDVQHIMEYEVTGPSGARLTFPNDGYDILRIWQDLGQGS